MRSNCRQEFYYAIDDIIESLVNTRYMVLNREGDETSIRRSFRQIAGKLDHLRKYPEDLEATTRQISCLIQPLLPPDERVLLSRFESLEPDRQERIKKIISEKIEEGIKLSDPETLELIREISNSLGHRIHEHRMDRAVEELRKHVADHLQKDEAMHAAIQQFLLGIEDQISELAHKVPRKGKASESLGFIREVVQSHSIPKDPEQVRALLAKAEDAIRESVEELEQFSKAVQNSLKRQEETLAKLNAKLKKVQSEARLDALTSLANRRSLSEFLDNLGDQSALLMVLDIDHFKKINDTYGHLIGDKVLVHVAKVFRESTRDSDLVARYGGEEFCIIMEPMPQEDAEKTANMIRTAVTVRPVLYDDNHQSIKITISVGVALRQPGESIKHWLARGDEALYRAKNGGRNRVVISHPYD